MILLLNISATIIPSASLKGSAASQRRQHEEAKRSGLSYIKDDSQLFSMVKSGYLVPITRNIRVNPELRKKFHFVRPWTNLFLKRIAIQFKNKFGTDLQVNSAVRTVEYQNNLRKRNKNAARRSSHPTGATIDLAKKNLTREQIVWLRAVLISLERRKLIEATEEENQSCFHIMVFKCYSNSRN